MQSLKVLSKDCHFVIFSLTNPTRYFVHAVLGPLKTDLVLTRSLTVLQNTKSLLLVLTIISSKPQVFFFNTISNCGLLSEYQLTACQPRNLRRERWGLSRYGPRKPQVFYTINNCGQSYESCKTISHRLSSFQPMWFLSLCFQVDTPLC